MKAILISTFGGPENLFIGEAPLPIISEDEILVRVMATALNRADILQRRGFYPPPPGESEILGLELAGVVEKVGPNVTKWKKGHRVFGLLAGGGYAEFAKIHQDMAIAIPDHMTFTEAAAISEVFLTAFQAITFLGKFQKGERILIHAGASGVGTAAIQIAKVLDAAQIIVTASAGKHALCRELGADIAIDYKSEDFESVVSQVTEHKGVDMIIDFMGGSYLDKNIKSMAVDGRMVMLAIMGGAEAAKVDVSKIVFKRLHIMGSTLRARNIEYKINLNRHFIDFAMDKFLTKKLKPVIDSVFNWNKVGEAHRRMESNKNQGKIVLEIL